MAFSYNHGFFSSHFFFSSLIILSSQTVLSKPRKISSDLLAKACNTGGSVRGWDPNLCLRILKSRPKIISSKDRVSFALSIIEAGIENATNTQTYMKQKLKDTKIGKGLKLALKECVNCFQAGMGSLGSAHAEIKDDKEYETADYDLAVVDEQVYRCDYFLTKYKVKEPVVSIGMKYVTYFSHPALNIVRDLESTLSNF